jgi:hypothetical protein
MFALSTDNLPRSGKRSHKSATHHFPFLDFIAPFLVIVSERERGLVEAGPGLLKRFVIFWRGCSSNSVVMGRKLVYNDYLKVDGHCNNLV